MPAESHSDTGGWALITLLLALFFWPVAAVALILGIVLLTEGRTGVGVVTLLLSVTVLFLGGTATLLLI